MVIRKLNSQDEDNLFEYFQKLSPITVKRFGPHDLSQETIKRICNNFDKDITCFVALNDKLEIIAYSILKKGYLEFEISWLSEYPIALDQLKDYTYAPSVADAYQSKGIGSSMLNYIMKELKSRNANRLILFGDVQESNKKAIGFYLKHGFKVLGKFNNNGQNLDMIKNL